MVSHQYVRNAALCSVDDRHDVDPAAPRLIVVNNRHAVVLATSRVV